MAIAQTGAAFKALTFDGVSSRTYGVYITGEAVYNAPERAVEMITIPGRNGALALDKGHFENIVVSYPAGIYADTEADFAQAISDFRNFLCSKSGYCKLSDEYNASEYRMAVYKSGLEVSPSLLRAGEFTITFECKPQRFLTSGDTASAVANNGSLVNPTLFPSSPLLELSGYGNLTIGGKTLTVANDQIGNVMVYEGGTTTLVTTMAVTIDNQFANTGDVISLGLSGVTFETMWNQESGELDSASGTVTGSALSEKSQIFRWDGLYINLSMNPAGNVSFVYGTSKTVTSTMSYIIDLYDFTPEVTGSVAFSLVYNGSTTFTLTITESVPNHMTEDTISRKITFKPITIKSTKLVAGTTTYIDLEIGEAYKINGGQATSVNNVVSLPAELPKLPAGTSTVTYDNTFSSVKVAPRWWKV